MNCSFCNKINKETESIVVGPGNVCICNECIQLTIEICESKGSRFQCIKSGPELASELQSNWIKNPSPYVSPIVLNLSEVCNRKFKIGTNTSHSDLVSKFCAKPKRKTRKKKVA